MNRELKFRGWNISERRMYNDIDFQSNKEYFSSVIMQFTGLHDKNGVPIYEGDILEIGGFSWKLYNEVFYYTEYGCFEAKPISSNYWKMIKAENFHEFKVVGNKYSNPELLKQKDGN